MTSGKITMRLFSKGLWPVHLWALWIHSLSRMKFLSEEQVANPIRKYLVSYNRHPTIDTNRHILPCKYYCSMYYIVLKHWFLRKEIPVPYIAPSGTMEANQQRGILTDLRLIFLWHSVTLCSIFIDIFFPGEQGNKEQWQILLENNY